jgi:hypothetical protein
MSDDKKMTRIDGCNVEVGNWIIASIVNGKGTMLGVVGEVHDIQSEDTAKPSLIIKLHGGKGERIMVSRGEISRLDVVQGPVLSLVEIVEIVTGGTVTLEYVDLDELLGQQLNRN